MKENKYDLIRVDIESLFDNESNKSTGGQKTYQRHINYKNIIGIKSHKSYKKNEVISLA